MASEDSLSSNPLLQNFEFPPFDVVDAHHVRPGIRALLHQLVRICCLCYSICWCDRMYVDVVDKCENHDRDVFIQEAELEQLEKTVEPSWPKLVEPLEKIIDRLTVVWGMINHLKAVKDTPELRAAIEEVQVKEIIIVWLRLFILVSTCVLIAIKLLHQMRKMIVCSMD